MLLTTAIKTLTNLLKSLSPLDPPDEREALLLSIEAIKACQEARKGRWWIAHLPLGGDSLEERGEPNG